LGLRILGRATALVHDRLVAPELLSAVPTSCQVFAAGKTGFGESHKQDDINALLVRLAREGHLVVRLKGGDPFVFGRGGEEIEACAAAGIPVEVVPGVSSSLAAAAWRGIPITHRGLSRSFAVVSAFHADGTAARIPDVETVVIMMPLHSMGSVQARFLEAGWDPSTPCAAIQAATTTDEREVLATLSDLDQKIIEAGLKSPILVVVGAVVGWAKENRSLLDHVLTAAHLGSSAE
jgi:uroporphyrinogen III methyltransferase/synthase